MAIWLRMCSGFWKKRYSLLWNPDNYKNIYEDNHVEILTLEPIELFGSKIKALIERHTCRDLYDVYNLLHSDLIQHFDIVLLRKIVVFYLSVGGNQTPSKEYSLDAICQINFSQIRATLLPMLKKGDSFDFETAKTEVVQFLNTILQFTESEFGFIDAFLSKKYQPEIMFSDPTIIYNISNHPMALWKIK